MFQFLHVLISALVSTLCVAKNLLLKSGFIQARKPHGARFQHQLPSRGMTYLLILTCSLIYNNQPFAAKGIEAGPLFMVILK